MREAAFLLVLAGAAAHAADPVLTATLEPKEIRLCHDAGLPVTFAARRAHSADLPAVDGLDFETTGQSEAGAPSSPRAGGAGVRRQRPVWLSGWFHWGGLVLVVALAAAIVILRRIERGPGPSSVRALRRETDRAVAQGDAWMLFAVLRAAVQDRLAPSWNVAPRSITLAELRTRGASGVLQELFEAADAVAYSGRMVSRPEMAHWQERVIEEIARMERGR